MRETLLDRNSPKPVFCTVCGSRLKHAPPTGMKSIWNAYTGEELKPHRLACIPDEYTVYNHNHPGYYWYGEEDMKPPPPDWELLDNL